MSSRSFGVGVVLLVLGCMPRPASAAPILGGTLIATGGDVTVTYVLEDAGDISQLYLSQIGSDVLATPLFIFQNGGSGTNNAGDTFTLDALLLGIDAGEELVFSLVNLDENETNDGPGGLLNYGTYFTGPASRNPDSTAHAAVDGTPFDGLGGYDPAFLVYLAGLGITTETLVGFEDRPNCFATGVVCRGELVDPFLPEIQADFDYNDLIYAFEGVRASDPSVPEPASVLLFGAGAAAYIARRRKQNVR